MHYALRFLIPLARIGYLVDNLSAMHLLNKAQAGVVLSPEEIVRHRKYQQRIRFVYYLFALALLRYIYLLIWPSKSEVAMYLVVDIMAYFSLLIPSTIGQSIWICVLPMWGCVFHMNYFHIYPKLTYMCLQVKMFPQHLVW